MDWDGSHLGRFTTRQVEYLDKRRCFYPLVRLSGICGYRIRVDNYLVLIVDQLRRMIGLEPLGMYSYQIGKCKYVLLRNDFQGTPYSKMGSEIKEGGWPARIALVVSFYRFFGILITPRHIYISHPDPLDVFVIGNLRMDQVLLTSPRLSSHLICLRSKLALSGKKRRKFQLELFEAIDTLCDENSEERYILASRLNQL